ncbi:MAG: purine-nucleoside phosphorylase [Desulfobacteraceae bacterium]
MTDHFQKVAAAKKFLETAIPGPCDIGFLTGTGLSGSTASIDVESEFEYASIPDFPVSTVEGHRGKLLYGTLKGSRIMAMQGRFHLYEGYSPFEVTFPVRVMQAFGVKYLVISNASGGINLAFNPGDIMIIRDHINLTGHNPLIGPNNDEWGIRFPDMTSVYDRELSGAAARIAAGLGIPVREGVYAGLCGPSLETPAETRYLRMAGGDAVGFSTVMEAIAGVHAGMNILGLATVTNINNPDSPEKATVEEIIKVAENAAKNVDALVSGIAEAIGKDRA